MKPINFDKFMIGYVPEKQLNRIKLCGYFAGDSGLLLHHASSYDIRLKGRFDDALNISIINSKYTFQYLNEKHFAIRNLCRDMYGITIHNGLNLDGVLVDNAVITYKDDNLIDLMVENNIL